jgi:hypothetical protein
MTSVIAGLNRRKLSKKQGVPNLGEEALLKERMWSESRQLV